MSKSFRLLVLTLALTGAVAGCRKEHKDVSEYESGTAQPAFAFTVYPGAKYLAPLTEKTKEAHKVASPNEKEAPPTAIYDTDAPLEKVAEWYASSYGFSAVAPNEGTDPKTRPPAYYRSGDLHADIVAVEPVLVKMNMQVDVAKAVGAYKAANINPTPNRPRVTLERPYFDVTTQQVVDRTLILMNRE